MLIRSKNKTKKNKEEAIMLFHPAGDRGQNYDRFKTSRLER